jgi:O-acetyl-ADP-ribose deacetylase (regulator of RNase III)
MDITIVDGELLYQQTEAIVNPWNRNIIPWWLLIPHGVSGAIKKHGGLQPFQELRQQGAIPPGGAVCTSAGRLPYKVIIHVASIGLLMRSSRTIIQQAVYNAITLAEQLELRSIAFPILGTGAGGFPQSDAENIMLETLHAMPSDMVVVLVRYLPS